MKIAYVDASHDDVEQSSAFFFDFEHQGEVSRLVMPGDLDEFNYHYMFNKVDLVLVNGNHFQAKKQVVCLEPTKFESLKRRESQLTDVIGIVAIQEGLSWPEDVRISKDRSTIPTFGKHESGKLAEFIFSFY